MENGQLFHLVAMPYARIEIRNVGKKLTNMEHAIIEAAKKKVAEGHDQLFMQLFLEEEIISWRKLDRYRNTPVELDVRSKWEMSLMNGKNEVALFKTII